MNKQKVISERKVRTKNTMMRVIKWERVGNDNRKEENEESVCGTHACAWEREWERERAMNDIRFTDLILLKKLYKFTMM